MVTFARNRELFAYATNASDNPSENYPVGAKGPGPVSKRAQSYSEVQSTI